MFKKGKKYTYDEIKEIIVNAEAEITMNPFGDDQKEMEKELGGKSQFMTMVMITIAFTNLQRLLFGKEK